MASHQAEELQAGRRFAFGDNWLRFLTKLSDDQIRNAERSLCDMLKLENMQCLRFLDIGSGSGLFSLAARRLGASVCSFDYDPQSVNCTNELKRRYFPDDPQWAVRLGSALDDSFIFRLGRFDVVYAWGVLHHTGHMREAFARITPTVATGGRLFIAIYNDQGVISRYWALVKKLYNKNTITKLLLFAIHAPYLLALRWLVRALTGRLSLERGMSLWHDTIDWLGGYPFEYAKPDEVLQVFQASGFVLESLKTCGRRMGCNEYVFRRQS